MTQQEFRWEDLLTDFSQRLIQNRRRNASWDLNTSFLSRSWLGFEGAGEQEISQLEERIQRQLPLSYREFLKTSNGWRECDWSEMRMLGVREIDWLYRIYPHIIENWQPNTNERPSVPDDKYFVYGEYQDTVYFRAEYLQNALAISTESKEGDIYLLIPNISTQDGEWEAWFLGYKLPGAGRYRSFYEMMQDTISRGLLVWW